MDPTPAEIITVGTLLRQGRGGEAAALAARLRQSESLKILLHQQAEKLLAEARRHLDAGAGSEAMVLLAERLLWLPGDPKALVSMSAVLGALGKWPAAEEAATLALATDPTCLEARVNRATARLRLRDLDGAEADAIRAVAVPNPPAAALSVYADALQQTLRSDEAVAVLQLGQKLYPSDPYLAGSYLYSLRFPSQVHGQPLEAAWVADEHRRVCQSLFPHSHLPSHRHPQPRPACQQPLRVAMVSADFFEHPVTRFLTGWLGHLDASHLQVIGYADSTAEDEATTRVKQACLAWRRIASLDNDTVARLIQQDQIDVLIDMSGHLHTPRLGLFTRRPAPIQLTYLGYPDTTGLDCFDGKLTDHTLDPPGAQKFYTEPLVYLDLGAWCYHPGDLPPIEPPAEHSHVVFGVLGSPAKLSHQFIAAIAQILQRVERSMLIVKGPTKDPIKYPAAAPPTPSPRRDTAFTSRLLDALDHAGVSNPQTRVTVTGWQGSRRQYLRAFQQVDLLLDSFPFCGHTTTFDALIMGTPMITLAGDRHSGRWSIGPMQACGLADLIAHTPAHYVDLAVQLAGQRHLLQNLRQSIAPRLQASHYCDGPGYARRFTTALQNLATP